MQNFKVDKYYLDDYQMELLNEDRNSLVIAGAGAGKTLTILGKVNFLIEKMNVIPEHILLISFTNATVNDLKNRLNYNVEVYTFHKLAMHILDEANYNYKLLNHDILNYITHEYLHTASKEEQKIILKYLEYNKSYTSFLKSREYNNFTKFIQTFINLYKTNDYTKENIFKLKFSNIEKKILTSIFKIYKLYIEEKKSMRMLDFDDLIKEAAKVCKSANLKYEYIIIDEFQDSSLLRLNLIKSLYNTLNCKVIVVGDDFQSIYHFSGCDLQIFLNFTNIFPDVKKISLVNTYRNSQELINIASSFVMKNKLQIKKELKSNKHSDSPIVLCPYTNEENVLTSILDKLMKDTLDIMILSRNNLDINRYLNKDIKLVDGNIYYKDKKFTYLTVHRSKGLEATYVIVLNCNNTVLGFPNKIINNSIIRKLFPEEKMPFAEERRLFYVALTRCKEKTFLVYDKKCPSIFIKEIKKYIYNVLKKITYFR